MALHGELRVNGTSVGQWSAVRTPKDSDPPGTYTYRCTLSQSWQDGLKLTFEEFEVRHHYAEGAAALAARVLARGTGLAAGL